ncbi:hypothetical protein WJX73_008326 [Symbiochloris irregularis]|uniref:Uncharacterized protein n=1 Tax=Symbiochloris irregularis TaxID=706552 RepID=A0AAW1NZ13_9CHLO
MARSTAAHSPQGRKRGRFSCNDCETPWFELGFQLWEPFDCTLVKAIWIEFLCMTLFIYFATGMAPDNTCLTLLSVQACASTA